MWLTFEACFDNPRMVLSATVERLLRASVFQKELLTRYNKFAKIFKKNISVLKPLNIPYMRDFIISSMVLRFLPLFCHTLFESYHEDIYQSVKSLFTFDLSWITVLEYVHKSQMPNPPLRPREKKNGKYQTQTTVMSIVSIDLLLLVCTFFTGSHSLYRCSKFKTWFITIRFKLI